MTNHYCDMQNADVILTIGSNNVENHPVSSKWVQRALDNGATWIVVDPRYTRSAEMADIYCPIRSGTDIASTAVCSTTFSSTTCGSTSTC